MTKLEQTAAEVDGSTGAGENGQDFIGERRQRRKKEKFGRHVEEFRDLDPVKMYLRGIGQVTLLDRAGEVAVAKEIEAGREIIFDVLINTPAAVDMMLAVPERLMGGGARAREVFE